MPENSLHSGDNPDILRDYLRRVTHAQTPPLRSRTTGTTTSERTSTRRADLVGFVNGLPWILVELKATHRRLETSYTGNLRDYKDTIPHLLVQRADHALQRKPQQGR